MLALKHAELLAKQQAFAIFLLIGAPHDGHQVEQESEGARKEEVDHGTRRCMACAA